MAEQLFAFSRPLGRSQFVGLCQESSRLTQLLFAPLGLPSLLERMGSELDLEELQQQYRFWEDALSAHLYSWKEVPADRVAASMHHYLEQNKDEVVMSAIRREQASFSELVELPRVVELLVYESAGAVEEDLNTAEVTATLLNQVLAALSLVADCTSRAAASSKYWSKKYGVDAGVRDSLGVAIPRRQFSPHDLAPLLKAADPSHSNSIQPSAAAPSAAATTPPLLRSLIDALDQALHLVPSSALGPKVKVTVHQYLTLLSMHGDSEAVQRILIAHLPAHQKLDLNNVLPSGLSLLDAYRIGLFSGAAEGPWSALSFGVNPIVSLLVQLDARISSPLSSSSSSSGGASLKLFRASWAAVKQALSKQRKARALFDLQAGKDGNDNDDDDDDDEDSEGKKSTPLQIINEAIEAKEEEEEEVWETDDEDDEDGKDDDDDDDDEDQGNENDDDQDEVQPNLPACLLTSLLSDRAEFASQSFTFDVSDEKSPAQRAAEDVDRALALDPYNAKAHGMHAQLAAGQSGLGGGGNDDDDGEDDEQDGEEGEGGSSKPGQRMVAAKAALAAFLLGGSMDLALASAAEEALRKESRSKAKTIFLTRDAGTSAGSWAVPRGWQVQAYLSGFDLPSIGLEVDAVRGLPGAQVVGEAVALLEQALREEGYGVSAELNDEDDDKDDESANGAGKGKDEGEGEAFQAKALELEISSAKSLELPKTAVLVEFGRFAIETASPQVKTDSAAATGTAAEAPAVENPQMRALLELFLRPEVSALAGVRFAGGAVELLCGGEEWPASGDWDDWEEIADEGVKSEGEGEGDGAADDEAAPAPVRARLLSLAGSLAFLLGLTKASVLCFRQSLRTAPLADTLVKLAALLNDMDEPAGAHALFGRATVMLARAPRASANNNSSSSSSGRGQVFCLLHMAELAANLSDFEEAVGLLTQARRLNETAADRDRAEEKAEQAKGGETESDNKCVGGGEGESEGESKDESEEQQTARATRRQHYSQVRLTIATLLGVTLFRLSPNAPEACLDALRPACAEARSQRRKGSGSVGEVYLLLCMGEVLAQCGDLAGSLAHFRRASRLYPAHPMPLINAARTYQQLNQRSLAAQHIAHAVALDPLFPMPHVDLAQALLYQGKVEACSEALARALALARHVGDIKDVVVAQLMTALTRELQQEALFLIDA